MTPPPTMTTSCMRPFYTVHSEAALAGPEPFATGAVSLCYARPMSSRSRRTFQQLVNLPDGAIPLAEAALLMACEEYPQLEISPYLDQLDDIAARVKPHVAENAAPLDIAKTINDVLFDQFGF